MKLIKPLVLSGPSGVGKGTLIKKLLTNFPKTFGFSISHTTRKPRPTEEDGKDYYFVSKDEMLKDIERGMFLEYANVHGNWYGTSYKSVQDVQQQNRCCIIEVDIQGAQQIKQNSKLEVFSIFISPPSLEELEQRLRGRNTETEEAIQQRLKRAREEIDFAKKNLGTIFDVIHVHSLERGTYPEFLNIIQKNLDLKLEQ